MLPISLGTLARREGIDLTGMKVTVEMETASRLPRWPIQE